MVSSCHGRYCQATRAVLLQPCLLSHKLLDLLQLVNYVRATAQGSRVPRSQVCSRSTPRCHVWKDKIVWVSTDLLAWHTVAWYQARTVVVCVLRVLVRAVSWLIIGSHFMNKL